MPPSCWRIWAPKSFGSSHQSVPQGEAPHLNREPVGPEGLIIGLGDDAVYCIDPSDNSTRILCRHPSIGSPGKRGTHGFFVTPDGVLYYGSEATLMRCTLPL